MVLKKEKEENRTGISLKETVSVELERIGQGGYWVWTLFILCVTPNILNGFHVSSYVFLGHIPEDFWCNVADLQAAGWSDYEIKNITTNMLPTTGCDIWDWNYRNLSKMSYNQAFEYTQNNQKPNRISCKSIKGSTFSYKDIDTSFVSQWDLICEKSVLRTTAQLMVSIGKFLGASTFGICSDKYGRRLSFIIASGLYITGSAITTLSPWYWLFLIGRMCLGAAASGLFYPAFSLLTENISVKHRSWMSIAFSISYPVGMLILALSAYYVHSWRYLQLSLSIPGLFLILICYLMPESPRWLLTKNREIEAYKIVFKTKKDIETVKTEEDKTVEKSNQSTPVCSKIKNSLRELGSLYGSSKMRRMAFTCYFMWCVTSLCYYVTALNADNLSANRYLYVAFTGLVDIPSYILPMILLRFMGRRISAFGLFVLAGLSLLAVLGIPQENGFWLIFFAMLGRFGISGVYSIVTLYTAELFPTEIRNSALGTSSTMAHIGSMAAPYVVDILGLLGWFIPTTICGCAVLLAGLLMLTLPETRSRALIDHVQENEEQIEEEVKS